jgi:predicted AAA+ superfamily ATPase
MSFLFGNGYEDSNIKILKRRWIWVKYPYFVSKIAKNYPDFVLNALYKGKISEHIVGQEFLAAKYNVFNELRFWVRDKKQSDAETDFLFQHNGTMFPVEVKSGTSGKS